MRLRLAGMMLVATVGCADAPAVGYTTCHRHDTAELHEINRRLADCPPAVADSTEQRLDRQAVELDASRAKLLLALRELELRNHRCALPLPDEPPLFRKLRQRIKLLPRHRGAK